MESTATTTIRGLAANCEASLGRCVFLEERTNLHKQNKELLDPWWSENQNARSKIWSSNLGVFAQGHASVDYRLRGFDEIRRLIIQLLEALDKNLSYCG